MVWLMIIEERKYNRKVHQLCERLMNKSGWEIHKPESQPNLPTRQGRTVFLITGESLKKTGYVGFCRVVNSPWVGVWIMEVCVKPEYGLQGIGKMLVEHVKKSAKGRVVIAWGVDQGPKFFEAVGFKKSKAPIYFYHTT